MNLNIGVVVLGIFAWLVVTSAAFVVLYYVVKAAVRDGFAEFNAKRTGKA